MSFCNNVILDICTACYEQTITDCQLDFSVGISGDYYITVVDKFNKGYTELTTVTLGDFSLNVNDYPDGLFNESSGYFRLILHNAVDDFTPLNLTIDGSTYSCIIFDVDGYCCHVANGDTPEPSLCIADSLCFESENNSQYVPLIF